MPNSLRGIHSSGQTTPTRPRPYTGTYWYVLVRKTGASSAVNANADWSNPFASTHRERDCPSVSWKLEENNSCPVFICQDSFWEGEPDDISFDYPLTSRQKNKTTKTAPPLGCVDRFNSTQSDHVTSYATHRCSKRQVSRLTLADNRRGVTGQS